MAGPPGRRTSGNRFLDEGDDLLDSLGLETVALLGEERPDLLRGARHYLDDLEADGGRDAFVDALDLLEDRRVGFVGKVAEGLCVLESQSLLVAEFALGTLAGEQ